MASSSFGLFLGRLLPFLFFQHRDSCFHRSELSVGLFSLFSIAAQSNQLTLLHEDLNQQGTQGQVLFVLEGVEAMTCEIENWLTFCGNFPRLRVWLATAQYDHSKYLRGCPPGIWTPPCPTFPNRRWATWKLEDVLAAWVGSNPADIKSRHILKLWRPATTSRKHQISGKALGQSRRNLTKRHAPKAYQVH